MSNWTGQAYALHRQLMYKTKVITTLYGTFLTLCIPSCVWLKPADKRVKEKRDTIGQSFVEEILKQKNKTNLNELDISWQQGLDKMYLSNPEVIQADYRIEDAVESQKQIWKDFIPTATFSVSDSFQLGELGDAFSNPVYRINSFLSLGNLLDLPQDLYERKLTRIGAELNAENTMRQQVIAMYRLFQEQRLLKIQKQAIDHEGDILKGITGIEGTELLQMKLDHKEALDDWVTRERNWKTRVGDFFITGYGSINLQPESIPDTKSKSLCLGSCPFQQYIQHYIQCIRCQIKPISFLDS